MAKCLTHRIRRRRVDEFRNKFADGKLGQAAKPVVFFRHNTCSLQEMCGRLTTPCRKSTDLARKNKDSIEGLAEEVGKFKV